MRTFRRILIVAAILAVAGWAVSGPAASYLHERSKPKFRKANVVERTVTSVVNSSGEVKPVMSVSIGSFVSGPITELHANFNDRVKKGQLMAKIDPKIYVAAWEGAQAMSGGRAILEVQRPIDHSLKGTSSWLRVVRDKATSMPQPSKAVPS